MNFGSFSHALMNVKATASVWRAELLICLSAQDNLRAYPICI